VHDYNGSRVLHVGLNASVTLEGLTLAGGDMYVGGGGIYTQGPPDSGPRLGSR
jgi:hypothetical protein